jgi:vacuolar iron transporter family protein
MELSKYSFGATSSITTSLAIIVGMSMVSDPKTSILEALFILALADNISDSLGIHIYRESQCSHEKNGTDVYTLNNFFTRLIITLVFAGLVIALPLRSVLICSITLGLLLLSALSYMIARKHKVNPYIAIAQHVGVSILAMSASYFIGGIIRILFSTV